MSGVSPCIPIGKELIKNETGNDEQNAKPRFGSKDKKEFKKIWWVLCNADTAGAVFYNF